MNLRSVYAAVDVVAEFGGVAVGSGAVVLARKVDEIIRFEWRDVVVDGFCTGQLYKVNLT